MWNLIEIHLLELQLLVLAGLVVVMCYLVGRRRSKTLSVLVKREYGRYKGKLSRRLSLSERLSSPAFVVAAFLIPIVSLFVVGFMGLLFWNAENNPKDVEGFLGTLHTSGAIVASFTAVLITIIIFSITVNSTYVVRASSLFKFYLRRLYFKPVLAFAAGTAGACLLNSIIINHFNSWPLVTVTIIVCLGYSVIALDLVVLFTAVRVLVRSAISEFLGENYVAAHRNSLLAHVKRTLAQTIFAESVKKLGFLWNPYDLYKGTEHAEYRIKSVGGFLNDVCFAFLERLAKKWNLRPIEKEEQRLNMYIDNPPNILIWPGQKLPEKEDRSAAMRVKDKEWESSAQQIFAKAFNCGKKERWGIPPVEWSEISHLLKTLIEDKDIDGVKSVLEAFRSIAQDYLENRRNIGWPHGIQTLDEEIMSPYRAPTLLNLDFLSFIRFAIRNEDEDCLDEIAKFLYRMANTAFEFESDQYFDEVLVRLNWLYKLSKGSERLAEHATANVTRYYENVGKIFDYHVYKDEDNPELYRNVFPFVEKYLKNVLNAMRQSAKYDDKRMFSKLLETANSLLSHYISDDIKQQYLYNYRQQNPVLLEVKLKITDVKMLSNLVISAWLYRGVKEKEYDKEKVKPLINLALERFLHFDSLIETYLLAKKVSRHESGLAYGWWDIVPGVVYSGDALSRWIKPFWLIIALRRAMSKPKISVSRIRILSPIREFDLQGLRSQVDDILKDEDHKWLTAEENIGGGREFLLGVFGALAQRQRKMDYEKIVSDSIDAHAAEAFKTRCIEAYENKIVLRNLLAEYQDNAKSDKGTIVKEFRQYERYVDKEDLIGEGRDVGLARICGEDVGRHETLYYAGVIEDRLIEKGTVENFGDLAARIKNEAARLRQKEFNPQLVLIPWDFRYEKALTDVPKWERQCPLERTPIPNWVTSIDGMEVFVWPHKDSECVGIVDISAFARFKDDIDGPGEPLNIRFRNLSEDEFNRYLFDEAKKRKRREFKKWLRAFEYDMTKVSEMKRIVVIEDQIRLEMLACDAGVKLLPNEDKIGIVYRQRENIYHLPECKHVKEISSFERRYFRNLGLAELNREFHPCENCRNIILRFL